MFLAKKEESSLFWDCGARDGVSIKRGGSANRTWKIPGLAGG